ncbi:MAG: Rpn family recombination-promoting nuclease/putative transposase, partial [Spirochaetia bacterium]|nr:Rpn family recombination-promoting nuclease/putative transposase [Spirochaetia bacterium]
MVSNRTYKDSVFCMLFNEPGKLRELYNALHGTSYGSETPVSINTLRDVLYAGRRNDISFSLRGRNVVLFEHQSSANPNMALRFLPYICGVYEKLIPPKGVFQASPLVLPRPEFIVFYNGTRPLPDKSTQRLSAAYPEDPGAGPPALELAVTVYNINAGHNPGLLGAVGDLRDYALFVAKVREFEKTRGREEAFGLAIRHCIGHNILREFLLEHAREVISMFADITLEEFIDLRVEEGVELGLKEAVGKVVDKAVE